MTKSIMLAACIALFSTVPALAQGMGTGPVATQCANDIQGLCANKGHGTRQTRSCLEASRDKVSAECRQALDTTGRGRGRGRGPGR